MTVKQWGNMTIETILALYQAGVLDEQGMVSLIGLLPTQQKTEEEEDMPQASKPNSQPVVPEASRSLKVLPFPERQQGEKGKSSLAERKASRLERLRSAQPAEPERRAQETSVLPMRWFQGEAKGQKTLTCVTLSTPGMQDATPKGS